MNPVEKAARALLEVARKDSIYHNAYVVHDAEVDALRAALSALPSAPAVGVEELARVIADAHDGVVLSGAFDVPIRTRARWMAAAEAALALLRPDTAEARGAELQTYSNHVTPDPRAPASDPPPGKMRCWRCEAGIPRRFSNEQRAWVHSGADNWHPCDLPPDTPPATPARGTGEREAWNVYASDGHAVYSRGLTRVLAEKYAQLWNEEPVSTGKPYRAAVKPAERGEEGR